MVSRSLSVATLITVLLHASHAVAWTAIGPRVVEHEAGGVGELSIA